MIMSTYQKAVLVSELQEMKRLKQSPHNYKFSHSWVYRHKMQRMWSMQGFLLGPSATAVSHTVSSPARAALQSPKAGLKSWLPACLSLSNCTHLSQQTNLSWPSAGSPHKTFCHLGFSHLSFDKFTLSKSAVTWKPAQSTVNKSYGHVGLDWPHRAVAGSHTSLLGTPLNEHLSWALCHTSVPGEHLQLCCQAPGTRISNCRSSGKSQHCTENELFGVNCELPNTALSFANVHTQELKLWFPRCHNSSIKI